MRLASFLLLWSLFYWLWRALFHRRRMVYVRTGRVDPTPQQRYRIYRRDGFRCRHCRTSRELQIDHIYPVCRGGLTVDSNLQTLCRRCNLRKGARV